jgi:magnesium-transporting ATPase (P-type)
MHTHKHIYIYHHSRHHLSPPHAGTLTAGCMTMVRMWVGGWQYKLSGQGYSPEGIVLPLEADNGDEARRITAAHPAALPLLNCLLGTSKQTRLQFDEKEKKFICVGNATERPMVVAAAKVGLTRDTIEGKYVNTAENPFNSTRKRQSVQVQNSVLHSFA